MNSHKHLNLPEVLAPILQNRNLKVIWIPSCTESIQCKGNYSLAGLIHLQPVWECSILEVGIRNNSLICVAYKKKSKHFSATHHAEAEKGLTAVCIRLPLSKCYNQSRLNIENSSANNIISLEKFPIVNKNDHVFQTLYKLCHLWWIRLIIELQLITEQI